MLMENQYVCRCHVILGYNDNIWVDINGNADAVKKELLKLLIHGEQKMFKSLVILTLHGIPIRALCGWHDALNKVSTVEDSPKPERQYV